MSHAAHKAIALLFLITIIGGTFSPIALVPPKKAEAAVNLAPCMASKAKVEAQRAAAIAAASATLGTGVLVTPPVVIAAQIGANSGADVEAQEKESCLDAIAWFFAKILIDEIVQSTVNWINSGFEGSPSFVENPGQFFTDVADRNIVGFLNELFPGIASTTAFLCSPFSLELEFNLKFKFLYNYNQKFTDQVKCRVTDIVDNVTGAVKSAEESMNQFYSGDFREGGWNRWLEVTQVPANNKYGAQILAEAALEARIQSVLGTERMVLDWGNGFQSLTDTFNNITAPGATIENALAQVTTSDIRQLELADEINELVGALMGQLMKTAFSSGGIAGLGTTEQPGSYVSGLTDPTRNTRRASTSREYTEGEIAGGGDPNNSYNVAYDKPTWQFNTFQDLPKYASDRAVNGIVLEPVIYPTEDDRACALSGGQHPWWQIDLRGTYNITNIEIRGFPQRHTKNLYVFVSENPFPLNTAANSEFVPGLPGANGAATPDLYPSAFAARPDVYHARYTGPDLNANSLFLQANEFTPGSGLTAGTSSIRGRYVRIQRADRTDYDTAGNQANLGLCEVRVNAY